LGMAEQSVPIEADEVKPEGELKKRSEGYA
jgi:hypothetical protein